MIDAEPSDSSSHQRGGCASGGRGMPSTRSMVGRRTLRRASYSRRGPHQVRAAHRTRQIPQFHKFSGSQVHRQRPGTTHSCVARAISSSSTPARDEAVLWVSPQRLRRAPDESTFRRRPDERIIVTRRSLLRFVPSTVVAGAAALALTTVFLAAPVAQATEVPHAGAGFTATSEWTQTLNDAGTGDRPLLAQRGQPRRTALGRRRRPGRLRLRLPPLGGGAPLAGPTTPARPIDSTPSVAPINPGGLDTVYVGGGDCRRIPRPVAIRPSARAEATSGSSRRPTRAPIPLPHSGVVGVADRGQLRRRVRRRGRIARPEHRRAQRGQRRHARRLSLVLRRLGPLDRRRGRSLRRRQQRDHHRWGLDAPGSPTGRPTPTAGTSASSRAPATPAPSTLPVGWSASTTPTRTSTAPRPRSVSSSAEVPWASPSATGATTRGASDSNKVFAINTSCGLAWSQTLDGITADSPAIANVQGNGQLDVVEGTQPAHGQQRHHLRAERHQRRHRVVGHDDRSGHRVPGDGRPDRRRLPGRHRPHHRGDRHLRRPLRRRSGRARPQPGLPELATRHRRPRWPHRHHRGGLLGHCRGRHRAALGDRRYRRFRRQRHRGRRVARVPPRPAADRRCRHAVAHH